MATSKDIKALMEARKARRAIPQTDPAETVKALQEPETLPSEAMDPAVSTPEPSHATEPRVDPRAQPTPAGDPYVQNEQ